MSRLDGCNTGYDYLKKIVCDTSDLKSSRPIKVIKTKEELAKYYKEHGEDWTYQVNVARLFSRHAKENK